MKWLTFSAALLLSASWAAAGSLGDAAKREKARREKQEKAAPATVIDEAELARRKAEGAGKGTFVEEVREYHRTCPEGITSHSCDERAGMIGGMAVEVADGMEKVDEVARRLSVNPGDVRAARQRHGMDDGFWDDLVRAVAEFRAGR